MAKKKKVESKKKSTGKETREKKAKETKTKLTPADVRRFKAILLEKRSEILGNVNSMEDGSLKKERSDLSNMPIHMADMGSDNYELENTIGLMDSERKLLREIDDALERIENGVYGICEGSKKPIPIQRLEAIPWARYSVEYAGLLEKGLVSEGQSSEGEESYDEHPEGEEEEVFEEEEENFPQEEEEGITEEEDIR